MDVMDFKGCMQRATMREGYTIVKETTLKRGERGKNP